MKSHINLAQNAVAKYVQQPLLVPKKFEVSFKFIKLFTELSQQWEKKSMEILSQWGI